MELGVDGVLMNTAIAEAKDPIRMARAMKHAVIAGREAYLPNRTIRRHPYPHRKTSVRPKEWQRIITDGAGTINVPAPSVRGDPLSPSRIFKWPGQGR